MDLAHTAVVVTGGARRLGAAITLGFAQAGADVVINYRTAAAAAQATAARARQAGVRSVTAPGDVARAADVGRLLATTLAEFGRVDVLVANAGAFRRTPIATLTEADWDEMLNNNLRAAFLCAHRFGLHMQAHAGGVIILLADVAGFRPWKDYLPYSVAKAGVVALTRGLAKELAPAVRVNAVAPGPVLFPDDFDPQARQREAARTLLQREGRPEDVVAAVLELARNEYTTGVVLPVDGGRLCR
ncbi:MAG: SDR family NAD(P)-dependent oxidoreductase [Candidatus Binatia bacterium]